MRARDAQFEPLDNASVTLHVKTADGREIELAAESSERTPGQYEATFAPRESGTYRAVVTVTAADGSEVGRRETGWSVEPQTEELRALTVNRALLAQVAGATGGEMVSADELDEFVSSLPNRKIPVVETWTYPLAPVAGVFRRHRAASPDRRMGPQTMERVAVTRLQSTYHCFPFVIFVLFVAKIFFQIDIRG